MKGLLKNNFYSAWVNAKIFSIFMIIWGIMIIIIPSNSLQMWFVLIGIVGFSVNAVAGIGNEFTSKWGKYKLTLPVKRVDIIKSLFFSQCLWLFVGLLIAGTGVGLSYLLNGCSYDQFIGSLELFALGISISLFMAAVFIPLLYLGGEEKSSVLLVISLLCGIGISSVLFNITNNDYMLAIIIPIICSLLIFILSYPLTVCFFKRKEY